MGYTLIVKYLPMCLLSKKACSTSFWRFSPFSFFAFLYSSTINLLSICCTICTVFIFSFICIYTHEVQGCINRLVPFSNFPWMGDPLFGTFWLRGCFCNIPFFFLYCRKCLNLRRPTHQDFQLLRLLRPWLHW